MKLKLHTKSKMLYAFLMALFSVWGWGQTVTIFSENMGTTLTGNPTPDNYLGFQNYGTYTFSGTGDMRNSSVSSGYTDASGGNNVMLNTSTETLIIDGINVSSYSNLILYVGIRKSTNAENGSGLVIEYSTSGATGTFTAISKDALPTNSNGWSYRNSTSNIPNTITTLRFRSTNTVEWRIDDVKLTGIVSSVNPPVVTNNNNLSGTFNSLFNYQVVATELPNNYAVSAGSLPLGLTLNQTNGAISGTIQETGIFNFSVTASNANGSGTGNFVLNVAKGTQTTTNNTTYNLFTVSNNVTLNATTNANKNISYVSSNPSVVSIVNGNQISVVGVGTSTITATASGDTNWNAYNTTINVVVSSAVVYQKINSTADLTDGYYVIANENDEFAVGVPSSPSYSAASISPSGGLLANPTDNIIVKIVSLGNNVYTLQRISTGNFIGWGTNTTLTSPSSVTSDSQRWTIIYDSSNQYFTIKNNGDNTTSRFLRYNPGTGDFRVYASSSSLTNSYSQLYKKMPSSWNGSTWSNGLPTFTTDVIITGVYSTTSNPAFAANNITIKNGGVLEINGTNTINAADVTVEDGGNLVIKGSGVLSHTGTFKVLKNGASLQDKYAFWSSPVASQNLTAMYPGATPLFITEYNTATDYFVNTASTTSAFAKGYSIKTPVVSNAEFTGTPNNGTQTFTLSTAGNGYNLVGNPYPSNLDLIAFYNANLTRISNTFYFWDNTSNSVTVQGGATTTNVGYATYNPASQIWTPAPNISVIPTQNSVKIGQGFIVKATNAADTSLNFNNDMRIAAPATFYNKNNSSAEGKFWLRLNSSYNTNNTFAVAYINGASNSFDQYDSKAIGTGSDAFYTLAGTQKLVIQGRESFNINDVVPVGAKHFQNGNFTISLVQKEGIFNNGQSIYLHDKVTGTYTDLQNNTYSFAANSGDVSSRFEIVYKLGVLSTSEVSKDSFEVYRNGDHFVVRNNKNIDSVIVYDASGRQIQTVEGGSKEIRITLDAKGVYVVKAVSEGKEYTKKIIK